MIREIHIDDRWIFPFVSYTTRHTDRKLPLIIQLHGAGERGSGGDELYLMDKNGFSEHVVEDDEHEVMLVMPQCPKDSFWAAKVESIIAFIEQIKEEFDIDEDRVYLVGFSMGGFGTWFTAMARPDLFAAIAPICGGGMSWNAGVLTMPTWTFHGSLDPIVPIAYTEIMVDKMHELGLDIKYTRVEGVGHDVWRVACTMKLLEWLLEHKRK